LKDKRYISNLKIYYISFTTNLTLPLSNQEIQQKKADKKRAEAERVAKLSPEEQRKVNFIFILYIVII